MSGSQLLLLGGVPAAAIPVDPYFYSVTSLLHGDGTNGGQNNTFLDSSTNNFTITRNGNTTQGSFSPFSQTGWGNYFDGATDSLTATNNAAYDFGSGAFTIEGWAYPTTASQLAFAARGQTTGFEGWILSTTNFLATTNGSTWDITITFTNALTANAWNHVAIVRNGNVYTAYLNGVANGTTTVSGTIVSGTAALVIGRRQGQTDYSGYISNFRIVKGTAVYTAAFTPPTTPLTAITNTSLLTCQSNRFIDNSTNAFTITANGDTSVQPFSPFNPTTAYSTGSIGGSGYFDGSGDYLNGPSTGQFAPTGNFTISMWIYPTSFAAAYYVLAGSWNTGTSDEWLIQYDNTGAIRFLTTTDSTFSAAGVIKLNQWQFISISRSGSTLTGYVNGTSFRSYTLSGTVGSATKVVYIGAQQGTTWPYAGYMADFRLVAGSAESATPPTAPATAISGTNMLLNFTNGAIFDNAAVADYETVGNAQISTSVKKYGTGSMSFDGTGDYLNTQNVLNTNFGSGPFTIECWVYFNSVSGTQLILSNYQNSTIGYGLGLSGGTLSFWATGDAPDISTSITPATGIWYHLAVSGQSGAIKMFLNGTQIGSTFTGTPSLDSTNPLRIGDGAGGAATQPLNGYIDDLRISKGIARYLYNFTPPTAALPDIGGTITLTADPYYEYTTLLLPGNGTNGAQNNTFLDSSTNAFTITRNGNTTQGTFSPFSQTGWSNYFDGTGDYLSATSNAAFGMGSGDYTIECWLYLTGTPTYHGIYSTTGTTSSDIQIQLQNRLLRLSSYTAQIAIANAGTEVPLNQWTHVAFCRSGSTVRLFNNGTQVGSATDSTTWATGAIEIGQVFGLYPLSGYMSNLRVVKGTAVYTANFTPPTTPLTAITNTSLLTCQSNRFIDNSTNAFAITRNGDASVQAFSPFNPTASWSAATYGGSGYFDGSGDYLTLPTAAESDLNLTGTFTFECWFYCSTSGDMWFFSKGGGTNDWNSTNGIAYQFMIESGSVKAQFNTGGSFLTISATAPASASWNHFAIGRNGTTLRAWLNGASMGTSTTSISPPTTRNIIKVGANTVNGSTMNGYLAGMIAVNGTDVYGVGNTTITVPTAPPTAITNTKFLANFTNAGIYDATSKNDLETVGNAQISTTQSKFGGSSMYFDGSGDDLRVINAGITTAFGTGDFTVEFWVYANSWNAFNNLIDFRKVNDYFMIAYVSGALQYYNNGAYRINAGSLSTATWYHVAVCRYSSVTRMFVNGIQLGGDYADTSTYPLETVVTIGARNDDVGNPFNGYMQDVRITRGIGRYTRNFTPPTTAFLTL